MHDQMRSDDELRSFVERDIRSEHEQSHVRSPTHKNQLNNNAETNELFLSEIKKWRDFALEVAEEHD